MSNPTLNENNLISSKKIKLNTSTSTYHRETFFIEGNKSDITIVALNKDWNLHTIFLNKSPYFRSMLSGSWIESSQKQINIGIEDANITLETLHKVFESFYVHEIVIEPIEAVPILACATLFQLDDLISNCVEVMKACFNADTIISFFEASELYGVKELRQASLEWLYTNTFSMISRSPMKLALFSADLMIELLKSHKFCEREDCIYQMLIAWVYLKENSSESFKDLWTVIARAACYVFKRKEEKPFLETDPGILYQTLFRVLRLKNLILYKLFKEIENCNVIPREWYMPVFKMQWLHMLRIHHGSSEEPEYISEEKFNTECIRTSGLITGTDDCSIEAFDFGFGFGLAFYYSCGVFYIMRDLKTADDFKVSSFSRGSSSSNKNKLCIMYRLTLYCVDSDSIVISKKAESGLKIVSLEQREKSRVLTVTHPFQYGLKYAMNFLFI